MEDHHVILVYVQTLKLKLEASNYHYFVMQTTCWEFDVTSLPNANFFLFSSRRAAVNADVDGGADVGLDADAVFDAGSGDGGDRC
ncbi:unnamed protein product [Adineta steineri]|uniref:Uncharacterized protein n=1 Tax=Adineta steineri TaxID=433720 RepID=A0A815FEC1_9BILA|nr:unnamed protein product [Adineta steineri]CAF3762875.1 unnamed protein product [Adineta steineri]